MRDGLPRRILLLLAAVLVLAACASATIDGRWTRPEVIGKRVEGAVQVAGVARDETVRRIYEGDIVAKLRARHQHRFGGRRLRPRVRRIGVVATADWR